MDLLLSVENIMDLLFSVEDIFVSLILIHDEVYSILIYVCLSLLVECSRFVVFFG